MMMMIIRLIKMIVDDNRHHDPEANHHSDGDDQAKSRKGISLQHPTANECLGMYKWQATWVGDFPPKNPK